MIFIQFTRSQALPTIRNYHFYSIEQLKIHILAGFYVLLEHSSTNTRYFWILILCLQTTEPFCEILLFSIAF